MYFILLFIVGNLLLFNLFIAILLSNFDDDPDPEELATEELEADELAGGEMSAKSSTRPPSPPKKPLMTFKFNYSTISPVSWFAALGESASPEVDDEPETVDGKKVKQPLYPKVPEDTSDASCHVFRWDNPVRKVSADIVSHWLFENTIVILIIISTILLLIDMPHLPKAHPLRATISVCNIVFTVIFCLEMCEPHPPASSGDCRRTIAVRRLPSGDCHHRRPPFPSLTPLRGRALVSSWQVLKDDRARPVHV
jgi:predicted permease